MEINIGAKVICRDGEAGTVRYAVLDRDAVVPTVLIRSIGDQGVELGMTRDELDQLGHGRGSDERRDAA